MSETSIRSTAIMKTIIGIIGSLILIGIFSSTEDWKDFVAPFFIATVVFTLKNLLEAITEQDFTDIADDWEFLGGFQKFIISIVVIFVAIILFLVIGSLLL